MRRGGREGGEGTRDIKVKVSTPLKELTVWWKGGC